MMEVSPSRAFAVAVVVVIGLGAAAVLTLSTTSTEALFSSFGQAAEEVLPTGRFLQAASGAAAPFNAPGEFQQQECDFTENVERVCSNDRCTVLATNMHGRTCDQFCADSGRKCVAAWEEVDETCEAAFTLRCDQSWQWTSDLLCECSPDTDAANTVATPCVELPNVERTCSSDGCIASAHRTEEQSCDAFCGSANLTCVAAWEGADDACNIKGTLGCGDVQPPSANLLCACDPAVNGSAQPPAKDTAAKLVWSDEFDGDALDLSQWSIIKGGGGFGNQELQFYREENIKVSDGVLRLEARCESFQGASFTSAKLETKHKEDWGPGHRVEVRARLPVGKGVWPAIWMLPSDNAFGPWPRSGEIDIMEAVGCTANKVYGTVHTQAFNHMRHTEKYNTLRVGISAWHTYAIEWTASEITWYVDDERYHSFAPASHSWEQWPFSQQFSLILNIAVGGSWGGSCLRGAPPSCASLAEFGAVQAMEVDYARVYTL